MTGMQRFVTYLYYYKEEEKLHNAGFAKIEIRGGQCVVEIHLQGMEQAGISLPVYLFAREGELIQAVGVGELSKGGGCRILLPAQQIGGSPYGISEMKGIYIPVNEQAMYASRWDDAKISRTNISIWETQRSEEEADTAEKPEMKIKEEQSETVQKEVKPKEAEQKETKQSAAAQRVEEKAERPTEQEEPEAVQSAASLHATEVAYQWKEEADQPEPLLECFLKLQKKAQTVEILETGKRQISGVRIELRDLRELPQSYWSLGNNSFLLHGFFVYRYLMFGKKIEAGREELFLGVPGICDNKERLMASLFGFEAFLPDVRESGGAQGYWCRKL